MDPNDLTRGQMALLRADAPHDAVAAMRDLRPEEPVKLAQRFYLATAEDARFLVLLGKKGTGKTVAAVAVLSEMLRRFDSQSRPSGSHFSPGMFVRANSLARLSAYDWKDRDWFEEMCRCGCLVLDDLGAEVASDPFKAQLYELLDRRYAKAKRTVITTNLDKAAFAARYGDRIVDRLREKGMSAEFTGESLRKTAEWGDAA